MKKYAAVFLVLLISLLSGCGRAGAENGEANAAETAPLQTEDLSYVIVNSPLKQSIEITGVLREYQTEYAVPAEIDGIIVTSIGRNAFMYAPVDSLILPNTLSIIKNGAFYNCAALTSVKIPDNVAVIEEYAFYCCSMLQHVSVSPDCTDIGGLAFYGTPWFESLSREFEIFGDGILIDYNGAGEKVAIPTGVKNISSAFYQNKAITSVIFPDTVQKIGSGAFDGCVFLTYAKLSDGISYIGDSAFNGCSSLKTLFVPSTVNYIGFHAFNGCDSLVLFCYPDSYAAQYAETNKLSYELIDEEK